MSTCTICGHGPHPGDGQCPVRPNELLRLALVHVRRYSNFLRQAEGGRKGVNVQECMQLLAVWQSVQAAEGRWTALSLDAQNEIVDALEDEGLEEAAFEGLL